VSKLFNPSGRFLRNNLKKIEIIMSVRWSGGAEEEVESGSKSSADDDIFRRLDELESEFQGDLESVQAELARVSSSADGWVSSNSAASYSVDEDVIDRRSDFDIIDAALSIQFKEDPESSQRGTTNSSGSGSRADASEDEDEVGADEDGASEDLETSMQRLATVLQVTDSGDNQDKEDRRSNDRAPAEELTDSPLLPIEDPTVSDSSDHSIADDTTSNSSDQPSVTSHRSRPSSLAAEGTETDPSLFQSDSDAAPQEYDPLSPFSAERIPSTKSASLESSSSSESISYIEHELAPAPTTRNSPSREGHKDSAKQPLLAPQDNRYLANIERQPDDDEWFDEEEQLRLKKRKKKWRKICKTFCHYSNVILLGLMFLAGMICFAVFLYPAPTPDPVDDGNDGSNVVTQVPTTSPTAAVPINQSTMPPAPFSPAESSSLLNTTSASIGRNKTTAPASNSTTPINTTIAASIDTMPSSTNTTTSPRNTTSPSANTTATALPSITTSAMNSSTAALLNDAVAVDIDPQSNFSLDGGNRINTSIPSPSETPTVSIFVKWSFALSWDEGVEKRDATPEELQHFNELANTWMTQNFETAYADWDDMTLESMNMSFVGSEFNPDAEFQLAVVTASDFIFSGDQPRDRGLFVTLDSFDVRAFAVDQLLFNYSAGEDVTGPWPFYWATDMKIGKADVEGDEEETGVTEEEKAGGGGGGR
jgi:hypothetical protein